MALQLILQRLRDPSLEDTHVFTFCNDSFAPAASITYGELESATRVLAEALLRAQPGPGVGPLLAAGDRVLLVFLPSLDFIVSFLAILRAGLIGVPVYPPDPRATRVNASLFAAVAASSGARVALSHAAYTHAAAMAQLQQASLRVLGFGAGAAHVWPALTWLKVGPGFKLECKGGTGGHPPVLDAAQPGDLAFLQYTSGSTSEPKGVMLTHGCLGANLAAIVTALQAGRDTVVVSWLPQYHDMGLIGAYLALAVAGGRGFYASPITFIKRPTLWITAISVHKATHVQAPSFAYALCARKWREVQRAGGKEAAPLDLSSLRHAFNAAEPVSTAAIHDFATTFAPYGFRLTAMAPGYGLAEHTVFVSVGGDHAIIANRGSLEASGVVTPTAVYPLATLTETPIAHLLPDKDAAVLVACGPVWPYAVSVAEADGTICVAIVEPESRRLLPCECRVGEVWLNSPSVAAGYYGAPELTAAAFGVELLPPSGLGGGQDGLRSELWLRGGERGSPPPRRWLRTGDLGFVHRGHLFIAGRLKDLLIVRGRNFYPSDMEAVVEGAEPKRLRPGCTAAFGGTEEGSVVIAVEVRTEVPAIELPEIAAGVRAAIAADFGVRLDAVVLTRPKGVQKTTSGKVARRWNAAAWDSFVSGSPTSPWARATGLVLLVDRSKGGEGEEEVPAEEAATGASREVGSDATLGAGMELTGKALLIALRRDVAIALGVAPRAVDTNVALSSLGLDSLSLMQLQGRLGSKYGLHVRDDLVWAEGTTLRWIAAAAGELRAAGAGESAGPGAVLGAAQPSIPMDSAVWDLRDVDSEVEAVGGEEATGGRRRPSFLETHFPCCLLCCG